MPSCSLGRYTHRVAISNSRLVNVTESAVVFRTKEGKLHTITPVEFLRRFIQHVLPDGFKKIPGGSCIAVKRAGRSSRQV
jgi:hypothetical protein